MNHGIVVPSDRSIAINGVSGGFLISTDSMFEAVERMRIMKIPYY